MEGNEPTKIQNTEPRPENLSDGVSFAEIVREKEARKKSGNDLAPLLSKAKADMARIIIGATFLVTFFIFLILSWRYNTLKERVFTPASLPFIFSMICLAAALGCGVSGAIGLVIHKKKIRLYKEEEKENKG